MTEAAIRAVVFDIGGVLVPTPLDEFVKVDTEFGLRPGTTMSLFRGGSLFAQCEVGTLPFAEFCTGAAAGISSAQGIAVPAQRLDEMMRTITGKAVHPGMLDLITELKAAGLVIGLMSNMYPERAPWVDSLFPAGVIEVNCSSYVVGQRKPEPEIYRTLIAMLNLKPAQILFVDDFAENVTAAEAEGLRGLLFLDESQCRRELKGLGTLID